MYRRPSMSLAILAVSGNILATTHLADENGNLGS